MRTRLARLLLAAARRLDPHVGRVLHPQAKIAWGEPAVRTQAAVKESLARQAGLAHYLASLGVASGGAILGPPSRSADSVPAKLSEGGPVTGFGDDDLAFRKGQAVRIELIGQEPVYRRVQSVERLPGGTIVTHFEPHEL